MHEIHSIGFDPVTDDAFVWLITDGRRHLRVFTWREINQRYGLRRRFDRHEFERAIRSNIRDLVQ